MVGPELENGEIEERHKDEHAKANQVEDCSCQDRALQLNPSWTCVSVEICQVMSEGGKDQKRYLKRQFISKEAKKTSPEQFLSSNAEEIGSAVVRIEHEEPTTGQTNNGQGKNQQSPHLCWR